VTGERAPATGARPDTAAAKVTEPSPTLPTEPWQRGWRRRAQATRRLPVLTDGCRDPWTDHELWPESSAEARRLTWYHLRDAGLLSVDLDRLLLRGGT